MPDVNPALPHGALGEVREKMPSATLPPKGREEHKLNSPEPVARLPKPKRRKHK